LSDAGYDGDYQAAAADVGILCQESHQRNLEISDEGSETVLKVINAKAQKIRPVFSGENRRVQIVNTEIK
jgi:hypothetical protein